MTEQAYIDATNLAKVRIAQTTLADTLFTEGSINDNITRSCIVSLGMIIATLEQRIDLQEE